MRKSFLLTFLCLLCVMVTHAATQTWTIDSWLKTDISPANPAIGENTFKDKTWYLYWDNSSLNGSKGSGSAFLLFGTSKQSFNTLTFKSSDFAGLITSVTVNANVTSGANLSVGVKVGGIVFSVGSTLSTQTTETINTSREDIKFVSSGASGELEISFTGNSNKKSLNIYSITVEYDPDNGVDAPAAPEFFDSQMEAIEGSTLTLMDSGMVYATYENDLTPSYTVTPEDAATVTTESGMYTFEVNKSCSITVSVENTDGGRNSSTLDVDVKKYQKFEIVKDTQDIHEGGVYVITSSTSGNMQSLSPIPNISNGAIKGVSGAITVDEDDADAIVVDTDKVAVFTMEKGKANYALKYATGEYLTIVGTNATSFNSTTDASADDANVNVTIGSKYAKFLFTNKNRILNFYSSGSEFRTYAASTTSNVYLYKLPVAKEEVALAWSAEEGTLDADFGWQGAQPALTIGNEMSAQELGIVYSSSDPTVATINANGEIRAVGAGDCVITAEIPSTNYTYAANPATFTLHVVSNPLPTFQNGEGETYEKAEVELYPSELTAGYTVRVQAAEGCTIAITVRNTNRYTVTYSEDNTVAEVTVREACEIVARNKKGDQTGSRSYIFNVAAKELAPAEISWTAKQYVYDLAKKQWNNAPELVNNYGLQVTYTSSDESVAKVSATGKVTPLEQGTTIISAHVEGTDDYNANTVTTTIRVTDSTAPLGYDVFEMVKKGDQLRENEQFIIVSGEPFNPEATVGSLTAPGGKYYAISPYRYINTSKVFEYYEAVPVEFPDGEEDGERLLVSDDANVLRLSKQFDTSAKNPDYPYLFQVMNEDVDLNENGEILDTDNPTLSSGNNERINGRYIQVKKAKLFSFVDLPENVDDRGMMNGNIRVLDPAEIEGYDEQDYRDIIYKGSSDSGNNYGGTKDVFTNKGEIIFNGTDGKQYFVRFNPAGNAVHFNVYELDNTYASDTRSKQNTFPVRIYRLANRVEKPSITVYPEEPVKSDVAFEEGVTYNNKVRVVIEQHPKTSQEAKLMRQWQKEGHNPALPDYDAFAENQIEVYVNGHVVVDENDNVIRYIDKDFNDATATRTIYAVASLDDVYSESAKTTFKFKASAPRISKVAEDAEGALKVRIVRPGNYTKDAQYFYVISDDASKPAVTFNLDGSVKTSEGTEVFAWAGDEADTTTGIIELPAGKTLWVGAFKAGYQPTVIEYNNLTVFPECRPMQLLRLTDAGRDLLLKDFDKAAIFDGHYDEEKPLYINYRNDLVNEDGTIIDSENHYHYMIQRNHTYGGETNRKVWIEQISEAQFKAIFGDSYINVDADHAKNFLWTSDYYVFALNKEEFLANFTDPENVDFDIPTVVAPDRTYNTLENTFKRIPTNSDGSYKTDESGKVVKAEEVTYYGAMMENQGKLGAKTLTTKIYYIAGEDLKDYETEASAETAPCIPSTFGFTYEYEYEREKESTLKADNPDAEFAKLSVPSAIDGKGNSDVLIPLKDLNSRHLNLVFKFNRPNISKHILQNYDLYYTIKFNRVDESEGTPVRTLLAGSGVYRDNEVDETADDDVYRFRIDDVHPASAIYPEIEISKVTYVGNSSDDSYGQYSANFGKLKTLAPAPNNSKKVDFSIKELWVGVNQHKLIDDQQYADWMYLWHTDMEDTPDIIINNPNTAGEDKVITINSSFYHIESYVPGTDYYSSYEYLVKHDEESHYSPSDDNHPYYSDEFLGEANNMPYDALRYTIIARDVPFGADGNPMTPTVVISPVYFFAYGADMKPLTIDADDNVIDYFESAGGQAQITLVNSLPGAVSPMKSAAAKAPRRAEAAQSAPSFAEYPMPHAGDTDMNHASILDLSQNPEYTVVSGGKYEPNDNSQMTGIKDIINPAGANGDQTVRYYNLQGVRVANPGPGFYIRVVNGQAVKVRL